MPGEAIEPAAFVDDNDDVDIDIDDDEIEYGKQIRPKKKMNKKRANRERLTRHGEL